MTRTLNTLVLLAIIILVAGEVALAQQDDVVRITISPLKPGIYQVRVAARDDRRGILGSAMEWIIVPDLSSRQLSLSSLILGLGSVTNRNEEAGQIQWSVDKRFALNSQFEFMTFIYNSSPNNLTAQVQVYKDGQSVLSVPVKNIEAAQEDPRRVPFKAKINLAGLQAGRYIVEVTVEDRTSNKRASQQTPFYVRAGLVRNESKVCSRVRLGGEPSCE